MDRQSIPGDPVKSLRWEAGELILLDQTRLPNEVVEERQDSAEQVWDSIQKLKVRGAPAIGIAGAYGLLVGLKPHRNGTMPAFLDAVRSVAGYLNASRPTAVNLSWGLKRMVAFAEAEAGAAAGPAALYTALVGEAVRIHEEDKAICRAIGEHGKGLIAPGSGVLTHCNAGALATSDHGTALSIMYEAHRQRIPFHVFADETRPLLQGARLTAWELAASGIDVTLICDNMAGLVMQQGKVQLGVLCDEIALRNDADERSILPHDRRAADVLLMK